MQNPYIINSLKVIPLGGVDEIGKNLTVYEYEDDILLVDCGCSFPEPSQIGVSTIIPDFTYLRENANKIRGLVITHAHEDHISGIPYFIKEFKVPIYASHFAIEVIKNKLEDAGIPERDVKFEEINTSSKITLGCFSVEFVHVNHSIPESMALAIYTPEGLVIHSGDFRIDLTPTGGQDTTDIARFVKYGEAGVKLLVCESTNAERPGFSPSENEVVKSLDSLFLKHQDRRLIISTFASNINRIKSIIEVAVKYGRKIAFTGHSMEKLVGMAKREHYINFKDDALIDIYTATELSPSEVVIITTGSQGEVMSALQRMSTGEHKDVELNQKDLVILSASTIPGNEKMVSKVVNSLVKNNIEVVRHPQVLLHVSGHAYQQEIKLLYTLTKPEFFIPCHGETVHLHANANNIKEMGHPEENIVIPSNGSVIEIHKHDMQITSNVTAGPVLIEGYAISDITQSILTERRILAQNGIMVVVVKLNRRYKSIEEDPEIFTKGFAYSQDNSELTYNLQRIIKESTIANITMEGINWRAIKKSIKDNVGRYLAEKMKRTPLIFPIIISVK